MAERFMHFESEAGRIAGLEVYRELYASGADVSGLDGDFFAEVSGWRLAGILLFDRRLAAVAHERSAERVRRDQFDHFTVQVVVEGLFEIDAGEGFVRVAPGQIALLDMTRPMRNRVTAARVVTASVAREVLQAALGSTAGLHGRIIDQDKALLLADYMTSLAARAAEIGEADLPAVSRAFIDLLTVAAGAVELGRGADLRRLEFARRESVKRFIEANLGGELTAEAIGDATGVSRATLYRIFQPDGGLGGVIQARRLVRVRAALGDPADDRPLSEIAHACGFKSESHMGRLFRAAFAASPGEYRRQLRSAMTPGERAEMSRRRWDALMGEIS
jgi:AraC-like DNA-binding protein